MTVIYWFRRDRRLSDNPALTMAIAQTHTMGARLLPVTLREPNPATQWGFARLGEHRLAFEAQSLTGLAKELQRLGSNLYQPEAPGIDSLIALARAFNATTIVCETIHAPQELNETAMLKAAGFNVQSLEQSSLLPEQALPFDAVNTPIVFSDFRRQIEKARALPREPLPAPATLPSLPDQISLARPYTSDMRLPVVDQRSAFPYQSAPWQGDQTNGQQHLERYFAGPLPRVYKETRNQLIGTDYSTKFSPWLAVGAISAAQIWQALQQHEVKHGANDSTYWIWFELLWRDHFRLMMRRFGRKLFYRQGLANTSVEMHKPNQAGFNRWCAGETGNDFIDAAMRELVATGYLSNRMRQNVASFLIHDLHGDWLAGAAWFEHCLVDFDVHSNQGNWAYIAGVGTDPRGGRRFNPDKQAQDYDSKHAYRDLWSHK
jgi:deoxyribodipyrimidine photo-lyase